jgi:5-methyltetrahydrofolate--homocysteine methyltransferase
MSDHVGIIRQAVIEGKHREVEELVQRAIEEGVDLHRLIQEGMIEAMDVVGKRFAEGLIFVPEMLVSAVTMKKGLELIKPLLKGDGKSSGRVVMATVKGDLHDIGKNLVIMMLEGAGFQVTDLGVDIDVDTLIQKVEELRPQVLGLSALLTTTMPEMARVIQALEAGGLRERVKVMVGGAPVDQKFADQIGADGYGKDAAQAVELTRRLAGGS